MVNPSSASLECKLQLECLGQPGVSIYSAHVLCSGFLHLFLLPLLGCMYETKSLSLESCFSSFPTQKASGSSICSISVLSTATNYDVTNEGLRARAQEQMNLSGTMILFSCSCPHQRNKIWKRPIRSLRPLQSSQCKIGPCTVSSCVLSSLVQAFSIY